LQIDLYKLKVRIRVEAFISGLIKAARMFLTWREYQITAITVSRTSETFDVTIATMDTRPMSMSVVCFLLLSARHVPWISGKYRAFCVALERRVC